MDQPPPPATNPIMAAPVPHASYDESVESSPRSRTTETWDDRESSLTTVPGGGSGGGNKLRLMCSYGGHIIPRPHDKSLCYVGGDTRMVVVDRNSSLGELTARLSKTLLNNRAFTLKYQLPNEDLDSLISVTTDEDLENMVDEFDRICASSSGAKSSRLRVFLFTNKRDSESGSSIESILGSSAKSEDWFYSALNGSGASARGLGFTDVNSVNSLLGLENDASFSAAAAVNNGGNGNLRSGNSRGSEALQQPDLSGNQTPLNSDTLMIETLSSFGSTSSSPSLANLPPIRVRVEDGGGGGGGGGSKVQDHRGVVEEQFAQMSVSSSGGNGKQDEGFAAMASPPPIPTTLIPATMVQEGAINPGISGGEYNDRIVSDDERSDQGVPVGNGRRHTQQQPQMQTQSQQQHQQLQPQQKPSGIFDIASPDSASSDGSILHQDSVAQIPSGMTRVPSNPMDANNPRIPVQQKLSESGYLLHTQLEQQQLQQQLQTQQNQQIQPQQQLQMQQQRQIQPQQQQQLQPQQQQQLQPQQFIHPGTHYIQHPQNAVPLPQYYHLYPPPTQHHHPPLDQQTYPFYFIPPTARQPQQTYNMSMQQAAYSDPSIAVPSSHPQTPPVPNMIAKSPAFNNQSRNVPQANPEMASSGYRTAISNAQPVVQITPGQQQHQQQYVPYSQVSYRPPQSQSMAQPQNPGPATNSNYTYAYSDPAHTQIYFTQPLAPAAAHPAQYQTMVSQSPIVMLSDASSGQNPNDNNTKQQNRTSQS